MKKMSLILCIATLGISCGDDWENAPRIWGVVNNTDQVLMLRGPYYSELYLPNPKPLPSNYFVYKVFEIAQYSYVEICRGGVPRSHKQWFDHYFTVSAEAFGEDVSWQILSENGEVLKTWKYSDRNLPGQRFFEETEWQPSVQGVWNSFVFYIMPEDIQSTEQ